MGDSIEKIIQEELGLAKKRIITRIKRSSENGNLSAERRMKLEFRNKISETVLPGEEIKGEGEVFIEVVLIDESTGNIVDDGPEASGNVKIFVLKGTREGDDEWTGEVFDENIVQEIEGKKPFLAGNICTLEKGIAVLDKIKFRNHASKIKPPMFRLGARGVGFLEGAHVKEAKTEPFTVKDFRGKYFRKHKNPLLSDDVCRLENICRGGKVEKRLREAQIINIEEFLIRLLIDPEGLKSVVRLVPKKWEATVANARNCRAEAKLYCYIQESHEKNKRGIVLNVLGHALGLYEQSQYFHADVLSGSQKADSEKWLQSAYEHWEDIKSFDDENSLQEYLSSLAIRHVEVEPDDSSCYEDAMTPKTMQLAESSNRHSNSSFQSLMNSSTIQETFIIEDLDVEITDDPILEHDPDPDHPPFNPSSMFSDFDFYLSSKRWRKLFCVSTWFSIWKRISDIGYRSFEPEKAEDSLNIARKTNQN